jgi:hypothetical protein
MAEQVFEAVGRTAQGRREMSRVQRFEEGAGGGVKGGQGVAGRLAGGVGGVQRGPGGVL